MQTSKQYHSLTLWVMMLISLSLLSACGGGSNGGSGSGSGSGDSNLDLKTLLGDVDEGKTITIDNNKFKLNPVPDTSSTTTLDTENQPTEWMKDVNFGINQNTQKRTLTIAGLYQTENDKYSTAEVTENGKEPGLGLIRNTGEALFLLAKTDFFAGDNLHKKYENLILGNANVDPSNLDNYVGDYGCGVKDCKDALAIGYQYGADDELALYRGVKLKIKVEKEDSKLKASFPAWFVSDQFNSAEYSILEGVSRVVYNQYFSTANLRVTSNYYLSITIKSRLFEGSTDDLFIAGSYNFFHRVSEDVTYFGVFALEKTN